MALSLQLDSFSRYQGTTLLQDVSKGTGSLYFGNWRPISFPEADDDGWMEVKGSQGLRLDRISSKIYGTPELWWAIACANQIANPFTQLYGIAAYAKSPVVFSADARECFYVTAKQYGANYNIDAPQGLTFSTTGTSLSVYVISKLVETFTGLSSYPLDTSGNDDPKFWGNVPSKFLTVNWLSATTLRPELTGAAPAPVPGNVSSYLTGGVDESVLMLRIPSLTNVITVLDASRTA